MHPNPVFLRVLATSLAPGYGTGAYPIQQVIHSFRLAAKGKHGRLLTPLLIFI